MDDHTRAIYRTAGITGRIGFGQRPAVLVVDFSVGFTDPASPLGGDLSTEIASTRRLLDVARRVSVFIVYTTVGYHPDLSDAGLWPLKIPSQQVLQLGTRWVDIDPRLGRADSEVVLVKKGASAFWGTNLAAILTARRVDTLLVAGTTTSGCVRASVVDAVQSGFRPNIVRECVGDRAPGPHEANLFDMDAKYGDVVSLTEAITYLEGRM